MEKFWREESTPPRRHLGVLVAGRIAQQASGCCSRSLPALPSYGAVENARSNGAKGSGIVVSAPTASSVQPAARR